MISFFTRHHIASPVALCSAAALVLALFLGIFFSAQAGLFVLLALWVALAAFFFPWETFCVLLGIAPLLPLLKVTDTLPLLTPLKDVAIAALFCATVLLPFVQKRDAYWRNPLFVPLACLVVWIFVALLRADQHVVGLLRARDLLLYIPLLWIARALLVSPKHITSLFQLLFSVASVVLVLGIVQQTLFPDSAVLRFDPAVQQWIPRLSSTLGHPNLLVSYLLLLLPSAVGIFLSRTTQRPLLLLSGTVFLLGLYATYETYSRGGWVAVLLSVTVVPLCMGVRTKIQGGILASCLLVLLGGILTLPTTRSLLRTAFDPTYQSNADRLGIIVSLVSETSPSAAIIGAGLGDTAVQAGRTEDITLHDVFSADTDSVQAAKDRTFVDNAIAKTWVEMGVVGIVLFGWIIVRALLLAFREAREDQPALLRGIAAGFIGTTFGLVALSAVLDVPEIFPVALYWFLFVGVVETCIVFRFRTPA